MRLLVAVAMLAALVAPTMGAPIPIVAAESVYGQLAQRIGGESVTVATVLANPDQDPHLFEATPSTARAVESAAIVLHNGAGYDPWMDRLLVASARTDRVAISAAALVEASPGDNPHLWYKPETLPAMARKLADVLGRLDPANARAYAARRDAFEASFAQVMAKVAAIRARFAGTPVAATEPVFGYMAGVMGLRTLNESVQQAALNGTEPAPAAVAAMELSLTRGEARLLIYNRQVTDGTTERLLGLAKAHGVPVVGVTETAPPGTSIEAWFGEEIDAVAAALAAGGR